MKRWLLLVYLPSMLRFHVEGGVQVQRTKFVDLTRGLIDSMNQVQGHLIASPDHQHTAFIHFGKNLSDQTGQFRARLLLGHIFVLDGLTLVHRQVSTVKNLHSTLKQGKIVTHRVARHRTKCQQLAERIRASFRSSPTVQRPHSKTQ